MALEFTKNGQISLENRLSHFENGVPTDSKRFEALKVMLRGSFMNPTAISFEMVNATFSPVKDGMSGMVLRTSREQFLQYCHENFIYCREDVDNGVYVVKQGLYR